MEIKSRPDIYMNAAFGGLLGVYHIPQLNDHDNLFFYTPEQQHKKKGIKKTKHKKRRAEMMQVVQSSNEARSIIGE